MSEKVSGSLLRELRKRRAARTRARFGAAETGNAAASPPHTLRGFAAQRRVRAAYRGAVVRSYARHGEKA